MTKSRRATLLPTLLPSDEEEEEQQRQEDDDERAASPTPRVPSEQGGRGSRETLLPAEGAQRPTVPYHLLDHTGASDDDAKDAVVAGSLAVTVVT